MVEDWPPTDVDEWMALVERTLRGRDVADLTSTTRDGIEIQPLYTDGPARLAAMAATALQRFESGWDIRTQHSVVFAAGERAEGSRVGDGEDAGSGAGSGGLADPGTGSEGVGGRDILRRRIEDDLAGGATSVELGVGTGVTIDDLSSVLADVDLSKTPLALVPHASLGTAAALVALASRTGDALAAGSSLGLDPLGEWARTGERVETAPSAEWAKSIVGSGDDRPLRAAESGIDETGASAESGIDETVLSAESGIDQIGHDAGSAPRIGPGAMAFAVDAVRYVDAGATEAQALGWATATGVAYLRVLVEAGLGVDAAAGLIGFRLAATADQFVTIAALRAARVMWARVVTASGGSAEAARQYQHAVTAAHTYSQRDPWVNLLRGACAALAAGVAGADAVTVLPFDYASGSVDGDGALGRRLARNTQLLLLEESHLARAADPAGGSFYVESLTEQLAAEGWRVLQDIETSGGIEAAIESRALAAAIDESWQSRLRTLRTRREPVVGVSQFPLLDDPTPAVLSDTDARSSRAGLPIRRLAEPFEDLRDAADRHRITTGERPAAWVAALGPAAAHSTRTAWTQNLLAAGGIAAQGGTGVDSPVAAAAEFAASGLTAAVITGPDDMYRLRGAATAAALRDAGATFVALACDPDTPAHLIEELKSAGLDETWHKSLDTAAALERLHHTLGIA